MSSPISVIGPMGRSLMKSPLFQIVGVVASVKNSTLVRDAEPAIYFNYRQFPFRGLSIVVQGQGDPAALLGAVRTEVQRLDPNLPLPRQQHDDDAGLDLHAREEVTIGPAGGRAVVPTGLAIAIPPGYGGFVLPRSGLALQ